MREAIEVIEYKGYEIKIYHDDTESSREWDNLGKMVCFHRRYNLGDKHNLKSLIKNKVALEKREAILVG